jgi:hypothetical protein
MEAIRVRKDYRSLKPAERERYFSCLRMLEILPPTEPDNLRKFIPLGGYKQINPRNIHDEIISSHCSSCEHMNPYFPYYHRHLMVYV